MMLADILRRSGAGLPPVEYVGGASNGTGENPGTSGSTTMTVPTPSGTLINDLILSAVFRQGSGTTAAENSLPSDHTPLYSRALYAGFTTVQGSYAVGYKFSTLNGIQNQVFTRENSKRVAVSITTWRHVARIPNIPAGPTHGLSTFGTAVQPPDSHMLGGMVVSIGGIYYSAENDDQALSWTYPTLRPQTPNNDYSLRVQRNENGRPQFVGGGSSTVIHAIGSRAITEMPIDIWGNWPSFSLPSHSGNTYAYNTLGRVIVLR